MAVRTGHATLAHGVMVLEHELGLHIQMTTETCFGLVHRDIARLAPPVFHVQASGSVTGLTGLDLACLSVFIGDTDGNARMLIELKVALFGLVTIRGGAGLRPNILGPWDGG